MKAHFERSAASKNGTKNSRAARQSSGMPRQPAPSALPKIALLWGVPADSPALVPLRAAGRLGLALRTVSPQELNATVGALCGISGAGGTGGALPLGGQGTSSLLPPAKPSANSPLPAAGKDAAAPDDPPHAAQPSVSIPAGPALVLCGLPETEREALLDALRAAGAVIPLKAIVTPTNQGWRFSALLAELAREHAALQGTAK